MAATKYSILKSNFPNSKPDLSLLQDQIEQSSIMPKLVDLQIGGDISVHITFEDEITPLEQSDLNAMCAVNTTKYQEIDEKTEELILSGFIFNGVEFSSSDRAQLRWLGLYALKEFVSYPHLISTKDDGVYSIGTLVELTNFTNTAFNHVASHIASGNLLKQQLKACTTKAEIESIVDNR